MKPFLGIYREPEFSPGHHRSNDAVILRLVGQALGRLGVSVDLVTLEEARTRWKDAPLIFSMCQGPAAMEELAAWKAEGACICNDPVAARKTYRDQLCPILLQNELRFPRTVMISTSAQTSLEPFRPFFRKGMAWVKRANVHATSGADVVPVKRWEDLPSVLAGFSRRGLSQAVLQEHREGDEVKFYAVDGGRLFWPYYPRECQGFPFDEFELRQAAEEAARTLGLGIYGGDAIIGADGSITLIDVNDWPSFAPCRGAAASAIAHYLKDFYHAHADTRSPVSVFPRR